MQSFAAINKRYWAWLDSLDFMTMVGDEDCATSTVLENVINPLLSTLQLAKLLSVGNTRPVLTGIICSDCGDPDHADK